MQFTEADLEQSRNLIKALKKARFTDIEGMEVLAFGQLFRWVNNLALSIEAEVTKPKQPLMIHTQPLRPKKKNSKK